MGGVRESRCDDGSNNGSTASIAASKELGDKALSADPNSRLDATNGEIS